ncbi:MAG: tRNA (N(6)-L-threonylcarbamoyladenosine(37)-C(2))-methylthiotransferase MtaB [Chloroflexi bacterium]|nr:tRNA (N(6)-L-threonylcarbamoyladenosine(37)-C(2))-methylthiotransferase MtaB [Chloroflexota bacterium]
MDNKHIKVAINTLGCKLNQAESESIARKFAADGYQLVSLADKPDIYIVNTCSVTHIADRKSRHLLRMARRLNAGCFIIAAGCYATISPHELKKMNTVDLIVNNQDKEKLVEIVKNNGYQTNNNMYFAHEYRTRAIVKVQDGCNRNCTYCIVPLTRGKETLVPLEQIIKEVQELVLKGYQEIVLSGSRLGANEYLMELVSTILEETNIRRLRLSSLQPENISSLFLKLWENKRLCRHIHMPLQSGCDTILKRMKRDYSTEMYNDSIGLIREYIPDMSVTTDIIVGFPGETDNEFAQSLEFCKNMRFASIHVFPYSLRPDTVAAVFKNTVDPGTKRARTNQMLSLSKELSHIYRSKFIGQTREVLWESTNEGLLEGLSDNYIRVFSKTDELLKNKITLVTLLSQYKNGLLGKLVN